MFEIRNGNSLDLLKDIPNESIDLIITSPPYFNLRVYSDDDREIGREATLGKYINNLLAIFKECKRVLKKTGSLWLNIGDVYINQCLACIPDILKIKLIYELGFICRNEIIWHKPNAMPSSAKTRFNNDFEKFFFFTVSNDYYFETQYEPFTSKIPQSNKCNGETKYKSVEQEASVRQGMSKTRGTKIVELRKELPEQQEFVDFIRHRAIDELCLGIPKTCVEHWFRRDSGGFAFPKVEDWNKVKHLFVGVEGFEKIDKGLTTITYETDDILKNADKGRVKRAVWSIPTKRLKEQHYAPFPTELVEIPIKACSKQGDVVMDIFCGSGTVGVVACGLGRNFIGLELNRDYCNIAENRILRGVE